MLIGGAAGTCAANKISGSVSLTGNTAGVSLVNATVSGSVSISGNSGGVVFTGDKLSSSVSVANNTGGLNFATNTISGAVTINSNSGGVAVVDNKVSGSATITNNTGGFTFSGNTDQRDGDAQGQQLAEVYGSGTAGRATMPSRVRIASASPASSSEAKPVTTLACSVRPSSY